MGLSVSLAIDQPPPRPRPAALRPRALFAQGAVLALVLLAVTLVVVTTVGNLRARGIPLGLEFLFDRADFSVAETLIPLAASDTVLRAMGAGIANTLFVSLVVIAASTALGVLLGIARLSANPLVSGLARVWVEIARNTPPILLLIFIYSLWWLVMPADHAVTLLPGVLGSIRGIAIPGLQTPWSFVDLAMLLLAAGLGAWITAAPPRALRAVPKAARAAAAAIAWVALGFALRQAAPFAVSLPIAQGASVSGGAILTPELFTVLFGLTLYTTGFVAEIVRGGINAVPRGQWEAARALGLSEARVLSRVVLPQMLRVVVPPMTSQYINVTKNSTLALAVGYTDFLTIMGTVINKTSHAVEGTLLIILVYLAINLSMSAALNAYNRRVAAEGR